MATIAERVQRGIDLLDAEGPKAWREMIDIESLEMSDGCNCILGQLYADEADELTDEDEIYVSGFEVGCDIHRGSRPNFTLDFGFASGANRDDIDEDFAALQAEWIRRLAEAQS